MTEIALTGELTSASTSSKEKQKDGPNVKMAGILQGLQASIAQLAKSSELQTETLQSLKEDVLLRSDNKESDETSAENESTSGNTPDVESTIDAVLDTSSNNSANAASQQGLSPTGKEAKTVGMSSLLESTLKRSISDAATSIIMQSWSDNTNKQYQPYIKKWFEFCSGRGK